MPAPAAAASPKSARLAAVYDTILQRGSIRRARSWRAAVRRRRPKPAWRSRRSRCGGRFSSIRTTGALDAGSRQRRGHGDRRRPSAGPGASRGAPKRGSTSPAPMRRSCSGASLRGERLAAARDGNRPSRTRSSARSRSIRRCRTPTSASACITTTPTSRRRRVKMLRWLLLLPGGDREQGLREMLRARDARRAPSRRSRLPAALAVSLVRASAGARARPAAWTRCALSVESAFPPAHRRSRSATTCAITPPAPRRGRRCSIARRRTRSSPREMTGVRARIGLAQELVAMSDSAIARSICSRLDRPMRSPTAPYGAAALAQLSCSDARTSARRSRSRASQRGEPRSRRRQPTIRTTFERVRAPRVARVDDDATVDRIFDNLDCFCA